MAGFLSDAERTRLNRFPAEVPRQDMIPQRRAQLKGS
jgi:hypothetical protein